jgi:UPF0755 protein
MIVLAVAGWTASAMYVPVTPPDRQFVLLRSGYSTHRIAVELKKAGVIRSVFAFRVWSQINHKHSLKAGEYLFEKPASAREVYDRIARGDIYFHEVTIPEGYTMFDIAKAMQEAGLGSAEQFLKIAQTRTDLIADLAPEAKSLEGYLFPNTYQFTRAQSREEMLGAMVHQFRQVAQQIGLTSDVQRIVTMAAIVEKETASPDERPLVASVYYNRLAHRMALDADPSVIYALLLAGNYSGTLHHNDLAVDSPYNTYRFPGLPPGPIASPGQGALTAALHPAESQYFYFVADGTGHHRFARDLEEHNRNVVAYRRALGMH